LECACTSLLGATTIEWEAGIISGRPAVKIRTPGDSPAAAVAALFENISRWSTKTRCCDSAQAGLAIFEPARELLEGGI
jgi:hypothetical protein